MVEPLAVVEKDADAVKKLQEFEDGTWAITQQRMVFDMRLGNVAWKRPPWCALGGATTFGALEVVLEAEGEFRGPSPAEELTPEEKERSLRQGRGGQFTEKFTPDEEVASARTLTEELCSAGVVRCSCYADCLAAGQSVFMV